ncbi:MAG: hypothetical protein V3S89_13385 [Desulfobacterales bacterium]
MSVAELITRPKDVPWLKDCEICNTGLCNRMDDLVKDGARSVREASRMMSEESGNVWNDNEIRHRYRYYKGTKVKAGRKPPTPTKGIVSPHFQAAFDKLLSEIHQAKSDGWKSTSKSSALKRISALRKAATSKTVTEENGLEAYIEYLQGSYRKKAQPQHGYI